MYIIFGILKECWHLFFQMSSYLICGFLIAGLIHIFLKPETISTHLGNPGFLSILKAVLFGVPLPLCSCGVLPPADSFYRAGASKGSVLAFLISTPTTGIDSIFATYGVLGGIFMSFRIMAVIIIGFIAGIFTDIVDKEKGVSQKWPDAVNSSCSNSTVMAGLKYAFIDLYGSIIPWLFWGILIAGAIAFLVPVDFVSKYLTNTSLTYLLMLMIGIPLYVCATGSIPIVASLIQKGLSPGSGLVFLIAGPATNVVTMLFVGKTLGKKSFIIYMLSIMTGALFFGCLLDTITINFGINMAEIAHRHTDFSVISCISSFILIIFAIYHGFIATQQRFIPRKKAKNCFVFNVPNVSCANCAARIRRALTNIDGVTSVDVNIKRKKVKVCCGFDNAERVKKTLASIGYPVSE